MISEKISHGHLRTLMDFKAFGVLFLVVCFIGMVSSISICIDNEVPSAPGNLGVSGSVGNILLRWDAAVDEPSCSGIDYYVVSRDGVELGNTSGLEFVDGARLGAGSYSYYVYAVDMVGKNAGRSIVNEIRISHGGGSSGGGSSSGFVCDVDWSCSAWGDCVDGEKMRVCEDLNECGTPYLKPVDVEGCVDSKAIVEIADVKPEIVENEGFFSAMTGAVVGGAASWFAAGLFVVLIFGLFWFVRRKRMKN